MRLRTALTSVSLGIALSSFAAITANAQVSGPSATTDAPAAQPVQYYPQYGISAGISVPAGRIGDDHAAGYAIGGLVEFAVRNQPYALRAEAMYQRFALKGGRTIGSDVNYFSLGPTVVYKLNPADPAETFLTGGIAIYHATDEGTRPGFNFGGGVGFPLTDFSALAEVRMHVMLADGKALLSLPLSIGVKF